MSPAGIRVAVTASTLVLAGLGGALLIAPTETTAAILPDAATPPILAQLLGAALLGFAAMNWIAGGSALGGIYGRAVVAANQAHFVIGALVLVRRAVSGATPTPAYWLVATVYVLAALFFSYLLFFATGLPAQESPRS